MAKRLTDIAIRNLKPQADRYEVRDAVSPLRVVVQPSGHKSFIIRYRSPLDGKPAKLTLTAGISLAAARKEAADALYEVEKRRDPSTAKKVAKAKATTAAATTFRSVTDRYMTLVAKMRRDGDQVTFTGDIRTAPRQLRDLERAILPTLGHRPVVEIRRSEIVALLDKIEMESGPVAADRALALIRRIMNWHATRADNFAPPVVRGMVRTKVKERARSRILTDNEIRAIWNSDQPGAFPALVRFLLLTGARRAEAAGMTWNEIDGDNWVLPAGRNKTKQDLTRPLSLAALAVIEGQRRDCPFVFSKSQKAISTFSRDKVAFDAAVGVSNWRVHDCRRTARSLLSRAGIAADIGERCLGHVLPGVRGTYDRHSYLPEMTRAYDALATLIERIANPPKGNVTALRKNKRA
jgi:integrase